MPKVPTYPQATPALDDIFYLVQNGQSRQARIGDLPTNQVINIEGYQGNPLAEFDSIAELTSGYEVVYVSPQHPYATDVKDNRGNNANIPFRTLQRALLEVTRRSFRAGANNDKTANTTIMLSPGEHIIYNGFGGSVSVPNYGRFQDAAYLLLINRAWLINQAYAAVPTGNQSATCKRDLEYFVQGLIDDLVAIGNLNTVTNARAIRNSNGSYISAYSTLQKRNDTIAAINALQTAVIAAVKNVGPTQASNIQPDVNSSSNPCQDVQAAVITYLDILRNTLNGTVQPHTINITEPSSAANFPTQGEPTPAQLQAFNSDSRAGVILPRGVSIVSLDLRKTTIKPTYVPPADGSQGVHYIFRTTGSAYFYGFTTRDADGVNRSHHNLCDFGYTNALDLNAYYDKVAVAFRDPTIYHQLQDGAQLVKRNLGWIVQKAQGDALIGASQGNIDLYVEQAPLLIAAVVSDLNVGANTASAKFGVDFLAIINALPSGVAAAKTLFASAWTAVADYVRQAIRNDAITSEGGFTDSRIILDAGSPTNPCQDVQSTATTLISIVNAILQGNPVPTLNLGTFGIGDTALVAEETEIVGTLTPGFVENSVRGRSPYIYNCTLLSAYGRRGIDGDGAQVTGFRSYVAAQYTIISLQTDPNAFTSAPTTDGEVGGQRYKGTRYTDTVDYRHAGYSVSNGAYSQLVSCFCIGVAQHYLAKSGGEFSITNSTSNFGDVSLFADGYNGEGTNYGAFPPDVNHTWLSVKPPLPIGNEVTNIQLGVYESRTSNTITLSEEIAFDVIAPFTARNGTKVYLRTLAGVEVSATLSASTNAGSAFKDRLTFSSLSGTWPADEEIEGLPIYIKRVLDKREPNDRIYRIRLRRNPAGRVPVQDYVFRMDYDVHGIQLQKQLHQVFTVGNVEPVSEDPLEDEFFITLLQGYRDEEGVQDDISEIPPNIDLDVEPGVNSPNDNPTSSVTYLAMSYLLNAVDTGNQLLPTALGPSSTERYWPTAKTVEFNKPSLIRCGGQTWEFMGTRNYNLGFPQANTGAVGDGINDPQEKFLKRFSKLQTGIKGGRIYATGIDELGNSYAGRTVTNLATGASTDIGVAGLTGSQTQVFKRIFVSERGTFPDGSQLLVQGRQTFGSNSSIEIPATVGLATGAKALYNPTTNAIRFGFGRPATLAEAALGARTEQEAAWVTPLDLAYWARFNRVVRQRTGNISVYVGSGTVNGSSSTAIAYDANYQLNYWPAPTSDTANPGLEFKPLATLNDAALWAAANVSPLETIDLRIQAGYYQCNGAFRCNVIINGVLGTGAIGGDYGASTAVNIWCNRIVYPDFATGDNLLRFGGYNYLQVEGTLIVNYIHFLDFDTALAINQIPDIEFWPYNTTASQARDSSVKSAQYGYRVGLWLGKCVDLIKASTPGYPSYNPSGLPMLGSVAPSTFVVSINGSVSLDNVTIGPGAPINGSAIQTAGGVNQLGLIHVRNSSIRLAGVRLRGNCRWNMTQAVTNSSILYGFNHSIVTMEGSCTISGLGGTYTTGNNNNYNFPQNNLHLQRYHTGPDSRTTGSGDDTSIAGTDGAVSNSDWETTFTTRGPAVNQMWWHYAGTQIRSSTYVIWAGRRANATTQASFFAGFIGKFANKPDGTGAPLGSLIGSGLNCDLNDQYTMNRGSNLWGSSLWAAAGITDLGITTQPANTPGATVLALNTYLNVQHTRIRQGLDVNTILTSLRNQTL